MTKFVEDSRMFYKWNFTTAICFKNRMICGRCNNQEVCAVEPIHTNKYNMRPVKYAALMTYKNIGLQGIERYIYYDEGNEQT